jgi:hypothetical protein
MARRTDDRWHDRREDENRPAGEGGQPDAENALVDKDIGARVSAVFTAAEKAAQHIIKLAHEEAADSHKRAEADAESLRAQRRYEAEEEARQILEQARKEAEAIKEEARDAAREVEAEASARKLRLREEVRLMEERIEWAREGLREVAARLDGIFPESAPPQSREVLETPEETGETDAYRA